jgi:hypothetical protein
MAGQKEVEFVRKIDKTQTKFDKFIFLKSI